jgi:hypothetical protein
VQSGLKATVRSALQSGSRSNAALNTLINDFARYHLVLIVACAPIFVALLVVSVVFWRRWQGAPKPGHRWWSFERAAYFLFALVSTVVGLSVAFVIAVNATNAFDARHGFAALVQGLGTPQAGTAMGRLYETFATWIRSGSPVMPPAIQRRVHERVLFHTARVVVAAILLGLILVLATSTWRRFIRQSRQPHARWTVQRGALLLVGAATVTLSLFLVIVVVANLQGAFAPITQTLLFG